MTGELVARSVEIFVDGAWLDISDDALNRDTIRVSRGVSNRGGAADPGTLGLSLWNGASSITAAVARYALRNPRSDLYGKLGPNTPVRLSAGLAGSTPTVRTVQEIVTLPPRWDVSGLDRWVPVQASGILRRLGIPSSPLEPTLVRSARREPAVITHWPLTDLGAGVKRAPSSISGMPGVWIRNAHLADWSSDTSAPGLGACPTIRAASTDVLVAYGAVPTAATEDVFTFSIWGRGDLDADLSADLVMTMFTANSVAWVLTVEWRASTSDISTHLQGYDLASDTELGNVSNGTTIDIDANWHNFTVRVSQLSTSAAVAVHMDDESVVSTSFADVEVTRPVAADARASLNVGRGLSFGGPLVFRGESTTDAGEARSRLYQAGRGFDGEPAGDRVERLCLEQGISLAGPGADVAGDGFDRTETDGWGVAPSGQDWVVEGGDAADYSVSSGQAHIAIDAVDEARQTYLAVDVADVDVHATFHPNQLFTGDTGQASITVRTQSIDTLYQFALFFHSDESMTATIASLESGTPSVLVQVPALEPVTYTASSAIRVRAQARGKLLRMKLWDADTDTEPPFWQADVEAGNLIPGPGMVGIRMAVHTNVTNTLPVTISVSDIVVRAAPTTAPMGPQHPGAFLDVLGECSKVESSMSRAPVLTEQREALGLRFLPLSSLYGPRVPGLELDYNQAHLAPPFDPTPDDFGLVNDATASSRDGGAARVEVYAGAKGITRAGRYDAGETFAATTDDHLDGIARWWTLHATWDEDRYPVITINMRSLSTRTDGEALVAAVQALDPGALIRITNVPPEITEDIEQVVLGITETISTEEWIVELHTTPAGPFTVASRGDVGLAGSRTTLVADDEHNAFPGAVQLASGDLLVAWRAAPQHDTGTGASRGIIYTSRSSHGIVWTTPSSVIDADPDDARDPMLSQLGNGDVALTYWTNDGAGALDAKTVLSDDDGATWGAPVDVATGFDDDVCTCPMRDLGGDAYGVALYARDGSDDWSAIWQPLTAAGAADGSPVTIADGPTDGRTYTEPYVVVLASGDLLCLIRETDGGQIWSSRSADSGATWSTPTSRFTAIGRPSFVELDDGRLLVVCRRSTSVGVDQAHIIRMSGDGGVTWTQEQVLDAESGRSAYAEPVLLDDGRVGFAYAIENSTTNSEVYWRSGTVVSGDASPSRRDSGSSETAASFDAGTETSLSVATDPGPLWGVTGDGNMAFPFDIAVDGVRLRVTGISGSSSPQTFTVEQDAVNGISKTIAAGSPVVLWQPALRGLWG